MVLDTVPLAPRAGWAAADRPRRVAAVLALPAMGALVVATVVEPLPAAVLFAWPVLGPALCYSLARVLRPEPRDRERTPRHLLASAATALGLPVAVLVAAVALGVEVADQFGALVWHGVPAAALGVTTAVWGALAWWVRSSRSA